MPSSTTQPCKCFTGILYSSIWYQKKIFNTVLLHYNKTTFLTPVVCRICFFSAFLRTFVQLQIWMPGWCSKGVQNEIICDTSRCHEVSSSESNSTLGSFDQLPSGFRIHPALRARIIKTGTVSFYNHSQELPPCMSSFSTSAGVHNHNKQISTNMQLF